MNLYELIQWIPEFIEEVLKLNSEESKASYKEIECIGKFHLGLLYDMNTW